MTVQIFFLKKVLRYSDKKIKLKRLLCENCRCGVLTVGERGRLRSAEQKERQAR